MYRTTTLQLLAVLQPQMADDAASSVPATVGEPMENLDSGRRKLQMPQVTSRPGSSHMRIDSRKAQTHEWNTFLLPAPVPNWSPIQKSTQVERISFNLCISHPMLITTLKLDSNKDMVAAPASLEE